MIFSIIFSVGILAVVNKTAAYIDNLATVLTTQAPAAAVSISLVTVGFNLGALVILGATAAIFFHQASRGLDLQYASSPDIVPNPLGFLVDYLVIFLQMVPFVLMAKSLDGELTHQAGFIWFFLSHEILILFGLTLLVVQQFRHLFVRREELYAPARRVAIGAQRYWFVMNSAYIALTTAAFALWSGSFSNQQYCPTNPRTASVLFPCLFFALAMARNWLDFSWMWNVFYPVKGSGPNGEQVYRWPLNKLIDMKPILLLGRFKFVWPIALGYVLLAFTGYLTTTVTQIFDLPLWTRICTIH